MRPDTARLRSRSLAGLWVAGIGFFVTRFTVSLAAYEQPMSFFISGIVPLVLGLSLAAFGIALVVGSFDPAAVRTIAVWCIVGTATMAGLVLLTVLGSEPGALRGVSSLRSTVSLANFLIGGGIGGTLTGLYAAQDRTHRRELRQQANQLVTLNRLLRHEVLNAVTVIQGSAEAVAGDPAGASSDAMARIQERSQHVVATIDDVKHLTQTASVGETVVAVDLGQVVRESVAAVRAAYPAASVVTSGDDPAGVSVWADARLATALTHLVRNAVQHNDVDEPSVVVETALAGDAACVRVVDDGPGLPAQERAVLERGEISELDDPSSGFGTNVARMLVERGGGDIRTSVAESGTTVEVDLPRTTGPPPGPVDALDVRTYGVDRTRLLVTVGAALVAGGVMGGAIQAMSGTVPVIGALYGVPDPLVGWITHEFHSVVFGLVFAGLLTGLPGAYAGRLAARVAVGVGWGVVLWLVASGIVMPVWLNLVGIPATVPSVTRTALATHLLWGATLAVVYHAGERWLATGDGGEAGGVSGPSASGRSRANPGADGLPADVAGRGGGWIVD